MKPGERFFANLAELLKMKNFITMFIIGVLCFKTITDVELTSEFIMIATAIVTHYFQPDKKDD